MNEEKTYKFKFTIETEDGEIEEQGWCYFSPRSISEFGECESIEMETGKYLRIFKKRIENEVEEEINNE